MVRWVWIGLLLLLWGGATFAGGLPAFPGAEGFGAAATGGRGGAVVIVTNLNASGTGSLQWAVNQSGARIVVFAVSGLIVGDVHIPHGDLTLAGQTAPGAGITLNGHLYTSFGTTFGNIIIRHLRIRAPVSDGNWPPAQHDAVQFSANQNLILDHVDISHGIDENFDLWAGAQNVTVQWSAITFPVYDGGHPDGAAHNYGLINGPGGGKISLHHNLWAHNKARTPALADGPAEVVNNVIYNGREGFVHHNPATGNFNLVGNNYLDGPSASLAPFWFDPENEPAPTQYHVADNFVDDPGTFVGTVDNPFTTPGFDDAYSFYCCGINSSQFVGVPFDFSSFPGHEAVSVESSAASYDRVLNEAGAWPRDVVNGWAATQTRARTGSWGDHRPADWLEGLVPGSPPTDTDSDGMPDDWESSHGLNPGVDDSATVMPSGYTAIEEYINELADAIVAPGEGIFDDGFETGDLTAWSNNQT